MLFSSLAVISILFLIPLTVSDAHMQESILIFENPVISTASNDYEISSDFDIRVLHDGDLIRVKGTTVDGHPYYVYQKMINSEPTLFGKIFIAGKATQIIQKDTALIQTEESISTQAEETIVPSEAVKNLIVQVESPNNTEYGQSYRITVKVYDADVNPHPELFSKTDGLLSEIFVNATMTDKNGNVLTTFDGVTDNAGKFEGSYYWEFTDIIGEYQIALNVDNGNHLENFNTFYLGYIPPSDTIPPP